MDILYLSIVFLVIVVIIWLKKPLFVAMIGGIAATIILFRVNLKDAAAKKQLMQLKLLLS